MGAERERKAMHVGGLKSHVLVRLAAFLPKLKVARLHSHRSHCCHLALSIALPGNLRPTPQRHRLCVRSQVPRSIQLRCPFFAAVGRQRTEEPSDEQHDDKRERTDNLDDCKCRSARIGTDERANDPFTSGGSLSSSKDERETRTQRPLTRSSSPSKQDGYGASGGTMSEETGL
jgi:hypothetical protein